jgi:triosephosphate isomerase
MPQTVEYPLILLNLKAYEESLGERGMALARVAESVAAETGVSIAVSPQMPDLSRMAASVDIPVFSQHVDAQGLGSHTGRVTPEAIREAGAAGTLINHSEFPVEMWAAEKAITQCRTLRLEVVACANNEPVAIAMCAFDPNAIAFEPPALIGTGVSVSTAQPQIVEDIVKAIKITNSRVKPLCGAGITNAKDVTAALQLGTEGVLLASGFVRARDPRLVLREMAIAVAEAR